MKSLLDLSNKALREAEKFHLNKADNDRALTYAERMLHAIQANQCYAELQRRLDRQDAILRNNLL